MPELQTINPDTFGPALFPYSQAILAGDLLFVAGQVALDANNQVVAPGNAYEQTLVVLDRVSTIVEQAGGTLADVAAATVFVTGLEHLPGFNQAWVEVFGEHRPARATVVAGLLIDGLVVEVQSTAVLQRG
jgi:2-iminobutanoate/2-iminopropanoate deaminase